MAIREAMNRRPVVSGVITGIVIVGAVAFILLWNRADSVYRPARMYFTVDDGKTYFADGATKLAPFDRDGKEAVQCYVFRAQGQSFVGYLLKYPPEVRQEIVAYQSAGREYPGVPPAALVKKPGDKNWVAVGSAAGAAVMQVRSPANADQFVEMVLP
jgi:hypothetical protein